MGDLPRAADNQHCRHEDDAQCAEKARPRPRPAWLPMGPPFAVVVSSHVAQLRSWRPRVHRPTLGSPLALASPAGSPGEFLIRPRISSRSRPGGVEALDCRRSGRHWFSRFAVTLIPYGCTVVPDEDGMGIGIGRKVRPTLLLKVSLPPA
jgi:hypothetical protein